MRGPSGGRPYVKTAAAFGITAACVAAVVVANDPMGEGNPDPAQAAMTAAAAIGENGLPTLNLPEPERVEEPEARCGRRPSLLREGSSSSRPVTIGVSPLRIAPVLAFEGGSIASLTRSGFSIGDAPPDAWLSKTVDLVRIRGPNRGSPSCGGVVGMSRWTRSLPGGAQVQGVGGGWCRVPGREGSVLAAAKSVGVSFAVVFGHAAPDSVRFARRQSVLAALDEYGAVLADLPGP